MTRCPARWKRRSTTSCTRLPKCRLRRRRVEPAVDGDRSLGESGAQRGLVRGLLHGPAPGQLVQHSRAVSFTAGQPALRPRPVGHGVSPGGTPRPSARRRARTARGTPRRRRRRRPPRPGSGPQPAPGRRPRPVPGPRGPTGRPRRRPAGAEVEPESTPVEPQRAGQPGRSAAPVPWRDSRAAGRRGLVPGDHLSRAEQDGRGGPDRPGHEVEAPVHPVREVHVGEPGRAEHRLRRGACGRGRRATRGRAGDPHTPRPR